MKTQDIIIENGGIVRIFFGMTSYQIPTYYLEKLLKNNIDSLKHVLTWKESEWGVWELITQKTDKNDK